MWGAIGPLRVRAALHTGAAEVRDGDYFGHTLSRATRIRDAGHGGQVLLSAATWELVRDQLPPDATLHDLGARWLKSLPRPEQIYQLVVPDLPTVFPPLKTLDRPLTNLPSQTTILIGRQREVTAVCELLRYTDVRLVTLTGPGGTGKTRLALQSAAELLDATEPAPLLPSQWETSAAPPKGYPAGWSGGEGLRAPGGEDLFPNGVWFVNLAPVSDPGLVASTIAQVLDVRESGGRSLLDSLKDYLRAKRMLLLLDNFEQIVEAAPLVAELLAAAPGVKVLVTSRMALRLMGEREYAVPPLGLPPRLPHPPVTSTTGTRGDLASPPLLSHWETSEASPRGETAGWSRGEGDLTQYEAVRLFIDRAQAVKADFAITNENAPAVAEICYRLDGLPLAIALAAARVKLFAPQALLARLDNRLKLLTGGARDLPARQQTIRNTSDWSYDLLGEGEKLLFVRLGVFVGGCALDVAEAVCNADSTLPIELLDGLATLVDQSLLRQIEGLDGEPRFTMLETIREYALERLEHSGEAGAIRRAHANYFLALAEMAEPHLFRAEQLAWLERLELEHDNLRAALAWSQQAPDVEVGLRLAGALDWFWSLQGYSREGGRWLEHALARSGGASEAVRAKALCGAGSLAQNNSDMASARACLAESLTLYRSLGDRRGIARTLGLLSWQAYIQGEQAAMRAYLAECELLYRALDDTWGIAYSLLCKSLETSHQVEAQALLEESLALFHRVGDRWGIGATRNNLGVAAFVRGDYEQAQRYMEEGLEWGPEFGDRASIGGTYANLGYVAHAQGDLAKMTACFAESLRIGWEFADRSGIADSLGGMGGAVGLVGQPLRAARLLGASDALFEAIGQVREPAFAAAYERFVADVRAQLDDTTFAAAYAAGRALPLEQAIGEALDS
jgi:predicted ATPase